MNSLARRWARHLAKRPMGAIWGVYPAASGLVFIALHFLLDHSRMDLFYIGILMVFAGFHLFERAGFLSLVKKDAKARSPTPPKSKPPCQ